jgi:hypothetical protein
MNRLLAVVFAALAAAQPRPSVDALKADVSYLASDELEGRATPSPGLDKAAEYIAAQFKGIGLEPAGGDGYFQTGMFSTAEPNREGLTLSFEIAGQTYKVANGSMELDPGPALDLDSVPVVRFETGRTSLNELGGKVVLRTDGARIVTPVLPTAEFILGPAGVRARTTLPPREGSSALLPRFPVAVVTDEAVRAAAAANPNAEIKVSAHIPAPIVKTFPLRNVVGVLRGSDPALKDTALVVSAHYDHLGVREEGDGDRIFNGANDDASGTASVIEIARALAAQGVRPKRSIVFVAFFGEERGGLGARYYVQHPVFPIAQTVADINLEQLGRTDDTEGKKIGKFNLTGFDYTNMADVFRKAAADAGVEASDDANSNSYFARSDNIRFSEMGVPSTTASVAYNFPDYHGIGDEANKLDYDNMAKVDAALALALFRIADAAEAPQWNADVRATAPYIKARESGR